MKTSEILLLVAVALAIILLFNCRIKCGPTKLQKAMAFMEGRNSESFTANAEGDKYAHFANFKHDIPKFLIDQEPIPSIPGSTLPGYGFSKATPYDLPLGDVLGFDPRLNTGV